MANKIDLKNEIVKQAKCKEQICLYPGQGEEVPFKLPACERLSEELQAVLSNGCGDQDVGPAENGELNAWGRAGPTWAAC